MKRTVLAITLILVICAPMIVGMLTVEVVNANFLPDDTLLISSPTSKEVYTSTSIPLRITVLREDPTPEIVSITYRLDKNRNVTDTLTDLDKSLGFGLLDYSQFWAETVLNNLAEGNHTLKVYSTDADGEHMYASVDFVIDTSYTSPDPKDSPSPSTEPTPTPPEGSPYSIPAFVVGSVVAIAVGLGLLVLVYFKKRKY